MSTGHFENIDDPRGSGWRTPTREGTSPMIKPYFQPAGQPKDEDAAKQGSFLSTKRMSDSQKEDIFENYVPIIKRVGEQEEYAVCDKHEGKKMKYFDISAPNSRLCSKCVLELVVDKNFNSAMTKEGKHGLTQSSKRRSRPKSSLTILPSSAQT